MTEDELQSRLSGISTRWTLLRQAHGSREDARAEALSALVAQYSGAAYRYLWAMLRDPDAADEVFQELALRFVRGDFRGADPKRGQFRHYLKTVLIRLVFEHRKKAGKRQRQFDTDAVVPDHEPAETSEEEDEQFMTSWREELLRQTWQRLEAWQEETGKPFYDVLKLRTDHADATSGQLAEKLTDKLRPEKPFTSAGVRKTLQRGRAKFSDLLLSVVEESLDRPTPDQLDRDLVDVGLIDYCRSAVRKRMQP